MRKKRILIVAPFPPPFGGIARYAQDLWESDVLQEKFSINRFNTATGEKFLHGAGRSERSWKRVTFFLKPKNFPFLIYLVFNYITYVFEILKFKPDVVHVHTCSYFGFVRSGLFLFLTRMVPCRRILHLHNAIDLFYEENKNKRITGRLISWSLNQATELVVLSEGLREYVEKVIGKKAFVVWNACVSEKYLPIKNDRELFYDQFPQAKGKIVILLIGGLYDHKGAFDLLNVISDLSDVERKGLLFILPGKGDILRAKSIVEKNEIHDSVIIPGILSEDLKDNLIRSSDIFVLPSHAEGQPIAILEAMSASLPIIASSVGSITEIVEDGRMGFIISPGDKENLKRNILKLAKNPDLRIEMGKAARSRVEERHDVSRLIESITTLYSKGRN